MALKEKAARRLCEKMQKAAIPFVFTGPWMLHLRGADVSWHGFHVVVSRADYEKTDAVLTRLGMRSPVREDPESCETHYHFDGADICLYAGFPSPCPAYAVPESPACVIVLGTSVPLMSAEDAYAIAALTGRDTAMFSAYFAAHPFDPSALSSSLSAADFPMP